jgi:hypothetical protein
MRIDSFYFQDKKMQKVPEVMPVVFPHGPALHAKLFSMGRIW